MEVSPSAKNLGVVFHSALNMSEHINAIYKKAFSLIRTIGKNRNFLDDKAATALVKVMLLSDPGWTIVMLCYMGCQRSIITG